MKCVLCKETIYPDLPSVGYAPNPNTFRLAWMHYFCFEVAYEDLKGVPPKDKQYEDRQEEYDQRFA